MLYDSHVTVLRKHANIYLPLSGEKLKLRDVGTNVMRQSLSGMSRDCHTGEKETKLHA